MGVTNEEQKEMSANTTIHCLLMISGSGAEPESHLIRARHCTRFHATSAGTLPEPLPSPAWPAAVVNSEPSTEIWNESIS